eukprot:31058-Pelagococcus_subviridis.AAC.2
MSRVAPHGVVDLRRAARDVVLEPGERARDEVPNAIHVVVQQFEEPRLRRLRARVPLRLARR